MHLFRTSLAMPLDSAIVAVTGLTPDSLSARWGRAGGRHLRPPHGRRWPRRRTSRSTKAADDTVLLADSLNLPSLQGRRVLARELDGGDVNIAPAVSPDGRYVAFLSERDLFGIDLFLADAQTGKVLKKLGDVNSDRHLDALRFINSAGTWSPDGEKFAFVVFVEGRQRDRRARRGHARDRAAHPRRRDRRA